MPAMSRDINIVMLSAFTKKVVGCFLTFPLLNSIFFVKWQWIAMQFSKYKRRADILILLSIKMRMRLRFLPRREANSYHIFIIYNIISSNNCCALLMLDSTQVTSLQIYHCMTWLYYFKRKIMLSLEHNFSHSKSTCHGKQVPI